MEDVRNAEFINIKFIFRILSVNIVNHCILSFIEHRMLILRVSFQNKL